MSFLKPERAPRSVLVVAGMMIVVGALAVLDGVGLIDLHGLALPIIAALAIVAVVLQRRQRGDEAEVGRD